MASTGARDNDGDAAAAAKDNDVSSWRAVKRRLEKQRRRERHKAAVRERVASGQAHVPKREARCLLDARLELAQQRGRPIVCLDCAYEPLMSAKEVDKLAKQINRMYGLHRSAGGCQVLPRLCLTSYRRGSCLATVAERKYNIGAYKIVRLPGPPGVELPLMEPEPGRLRRVVYLTPDSSNTLDTVQVDGSVAYVIGGLVDEARRPGVSCAAAAAAAAASDVVPGGPAISISTARLPISEHLVSATCPTPRQLDRTPLPVNAVYGVLLDVANRGGWADALMRHLPVARLRLSARGDATKD